MKKSIFLLLSIISLILLGFNGYTQLKISQLENSLRNYLMYEKNYEESDIQSLEGKRSKLPRYPIFVVFKDEPDKIYMYTLLSNGRWSQLKPNEDDLRTTIYKHAE